MSELRRAAQQALYVLETNDASAVYEVITALRAALKTQPEPEAALDEEKRREKIVQRLNALEASNLAVETALIVNHKEIMRLIDISKNLSERIREVEMQQRSKT